MAKVRVIEENTKYWGDTIYIHNNRITGGKPYGRSFKLLPDGTLELNTKVSQEQGMAGYNDGILNIHEWYAALDEIAQLGIKYL